MYAVSAVKLNVLVFMEKRWSPPASSMRPSRDSGIGVLSDMRANAAALAQSVLTTTIWPGETCCVVE